MCVNQLVKATDARNVKRGPGGRGLGGTRGAENEEERTYLDKPGLAYMRKDARSGKIVKNI